MTDDKSLLDRGIKTIPSINHLFSSTHHICLSGVNQQSRLSGENLKRKGFGAGATFALKQATSGDNAIVLKHFCLINSPLKYFGNAKKVILEKKG